MKAKLTIFGLILILILSACGPTNNADNAVNSNDGAVANNAVNTNDSANSNDAANSSDDAAPVESNEPFKFGIVLVGPKNDRGWSQAHFEGGEYIANNMDNAEMIVFELLNPADKPEATLEGVVDDMVAEGATLIFTTSDEFEEDTNGVAEKYPDITFINVSGDDALTGEAPANLGNVMGQMEPMKAIAGCAAALATQTSQIGYVGPLINHETLREAASAYLGAAYCYDNYRGMDVADLQFTVSWIGFWFNIPGVTFDPTEVTTNFFDTGVDVVMSGIDTSEPIDVSGQRAANGEAVFAVPYDYRGACDSAPSICLGVPYFNWGPAYIDVAERVASGTYEAGWEWVEPYWEDITDSDMSTVGWVNGDALVGDMETNLNDFIAGLASGDIDVWSGPINLQDGTSYVADGDVATDSQIWYLPMLVEGMDGPSE